MMPERFASRALCRPTVGCRPAAGCTGAFLLCACLARAQAAEEPAPRGLLSLALRSVEERTGDYDALAAAWIRAVGEAAESKPPADGAQAPAVADDLVLELVLRRLLALRPWLSDPAQLIPAVEAAVNRPFTNGLHRHTLRAFLLDLYRAAGRAEDREALVSASGYLRSWAVIGPFGNGGPSQLQRAFPPESKIDPEASYPGRKSLLRWRVPPRPPGADPFFVPARWIYPRQGVVYLFSRLTAPRPLEAVLHFGCPEALEVRVNGRVVLHDDLDRPRIDRRSAGVKLAAGENQILLKTHVTSDAWIWVRLSTPDGEPLRGIVEEPLAAEGGGGLRAVPPTRYSSEVVGEPAWPGPFHAGAPFRAGAIEEWEAAVSRLEKGRTPPNLLADASMGLALLHLHAGFPSRAVLHAQRAVALVPGDAASSAHAGEVYLGARYLPRDHARSLARSAFEAAVKADPGYLPARLPLARMLLESNEAARAAETLETASGQGPRFLAARLDLLRLFQSREWEAEADAQARAIEGAFPRRREPALHRARLHRERENAPAALRELRVAFEVDRSQAELLVEIAELSEETGDPKGAEEALLLALKLDPEDSGLGQALSDFLERRGAWDRALAIHAGLAERNPADPAPPAAQGRILERAQRPKEALAAYDRALALEPGDITLARYRASLASAGEAAGSAAARDEFWKPYDEDLDEWLGRIPSAEHFPRASTAAVLDITVLKFYPDGSHSEYTHQAFRLLSEEGKEEVARAATPGEIVQLRTVTADGRTLEPVPATGKERFIMPGLAPGATVEWAYRVDHSRFDDWILRGGNFFFQDFQYRKPFLLSRYAVMLPRGLDVDLIERALSGNQGSSALAKVKREEHEMPGGYRVVVYEARDVPRLDREVAMPHREDYLPNVELLSKRTWDAVASRAGDSVLGLTFTTPEIEAAAAEMTSGLADPIEKARAIYRRVNELVAEGSGPRDAVGILVTRSGDRTVLFKALCDAAGIPSRWAFLRPKESLLPRDDGSHPVPNAFSERVVLFEKAGAAPFWVSLDVRRAPFGKLPFELQGGTALVLEQDGGSKFMPVAQEPLEEVASYTTLALTLSGKDLPDLAILADVEVSMPALEGYQQKERLRTVKEDMKRQIFAGGAAGIFPGARLLEGDLPGLADPDSPFRLRLRLQAPKALSARGEDEVLLRPIPRPAEVVKRFIQRPRREHPYRLGGEMVMRDSIRIETGPRLRLERVPSNVSHTSPLGSYSLVFRRAGPDGQGGEALIVERSITFLPTTLPADDFPRLLEFARAIDRAEEERLVLARTKA